MLYTLPVLALGLTATPAGPAFSAAAARAAPATMGIGLGSLMSKVTSKGYTGKVVPTTTQFSPSVLQAVGLSQEQQAELLEKPGTLVYMASPIEGEADPAAAVLPVTEAEVMAAQAGWSNAIKSISATYLKGGDFVQAAADAAAELYGYGHTKVLFKPTKATKHPFRPTGAEAMSYFVGANAVKDGYEGEDAGFAINGGKGWSSVAFDNHQIDLNGPTATAMGAYVFTCATTGDLVKVEYTFGYKRCADGKVRIYLHHSSVPYKEAPPAVSEAEVLEAQAKWAGAIKSISAAYLDKKDYINTAAEAAGELYGYGHSNVLFKPTKAAEFPFRPTGAEAMSYFVGGEVVENGYKEDAGFAINGGKGWKDVEFTNHQIDLNGPVAIAMGSYVFTCATTGDKAKVEYTFGYKRNDDGKARIFLHHSSVPYSS